MAARRTVLGVINNKYINLYVCNTLFKCSSRYFHHFNNNVNIYLIKNLFPADFKRKFFTRDIYITSFHFLYLITFNSTHFHLNITTFGK